MLLDAADELHMVDIMGDDDVLSFYEALGFQQAGLSAGVSPDAAVRVMLQTHIADVALCELASETCGEAAQEFSSMEQLHAAPCRTSIDAVSPRPSGYVDFGVVLVDPRVSRVRSPLVTKAS